MLPPLLVLVLYYCFSLLHFPHRTKKKKEVKLKIIFMMFRDDPILDLCFRFNGGLNFCQLKCFPYSFPSPSMLNYFHLSIIIYILFFVIYRFDGFLSAVYRRCPSLAASTSCINSSKKVCVYRDCCEFYCRFSFLKITKFSFTRRKSVNRSPLIIKIGISQRPWWVYFVVMFQDMKNSLAMTKFEFFLKSGHDTGRLCIHGKHSSFFRCMLSLGFTCYLHFVVVVNMKSTRWSFFSFHCSM